MEVKTIVIGVIALIIGGILLASMLPTALNSIYDTNSNAFRFSSAGHLDGNSKPIARDLNVTHDAATAAIWNILPLFAVLGGMGILIGFVYKEYKS